MSGIDIKQVKRLREETGVGIMASKKALEDAGGDFEKAKELLEERVAMRAEKRSDQETAEGVVVAYVHSDGKNGALVELCAETDFVSHRDEFKDLAYELAMQICAMAPEDKEELLEQEWIRDPEKKIKDLIQEMAVKTKENVEIGNFYRIAVGEE